MARKIKITWPVIKKMIAEGRGIGFGESYKSWLDITRSSTSKVSTQVTQPIPPFRRRCNFMSQSEYLIALAFSWIGAEVREQFPLWPWEHPHPESGRKPINDRLFKGSPGMIEICREAGFSNGTFPGTQIPYIWTMDLCVHLPWIRNPANSTLMVSVKPEQIIAATDASAFSRVREKLEGERRYCQESNIKYLSGDHTVFPAKIFEMLDTLRGSAVIPDSHPAIPIMRSFLEKHLHRLNEEPLSYTILVLKKDYGCDHKTACLIRNHLIWHQMIDVDLTKRINYMNPPVAGGRRLREKIMKNLEALR